MRILVTGGCGFIGSSLVRALLGRGFQVTALDNLDPQVHGPAPTPPPAADGFRFVHGDVLDGTAVKDALEDADAVIHLAAAVGVGQSMYQVAHYVRTNELGTAMVLQAIVDRGRPLSRLVVASSNTIYGEGAYDCPGCGPVRIGTRSLVDLEDRRWEPACPKCHQRLEPRPTTEHTAPHPTTVYAIGKRTQEELVLTVGGSFGVPSVALRFFNVYGPGQSLDNPYTGVAAILSTRMLTGKAPVIFEDGLQTRDFTHVEDIVQGILLALEHPAAVGRVMNVGTGVPTTVLELCRMLAAELGYQGPIDVVEKARVGDIRHCVASIDRLAGLGYTPRRTLASSVGELAAWVRGQQVTDRLDEAMAQLENHHLVR